jgi:hypothetical protein
MPKAAIERGFAMRVADLQELPHILQAQCAPDKNKAEIGENKRATGAGSN